MMNRFFRYVLFFEKVILSAISGMGYLFISIMMKNNVWVSIFLAIIISIINAIWLLRDTIYNEQ